MHLNRTLLVSLLIISAIASCKSSDPEKKDTLFEKVDSATSGVTFRNDLPFDEEFNIFTYRNFYNGGGVALGDVNNDGLIDIYLTSNLGENKLYLNEGEFQVQGYHSNSRSSRYPGLEYRCRHG
jgi:enediyne biosynthesis protein E4